MSAWGDDRHADTAAQIPEAYWHARHAYPYRLGPERKQQPAPWALVFWELLTGGIWGALIMRAVAG